MRWDQTRAFRARDRLLSALLAGWEPDAMRVEAKRVGGDAGALLASLADSHERGRKTIDDPDGVT